MTSAGFDGTTLLLQEDLLHDGHTVAQTDDAITNPELLAPDIRRAFTQIEDEGALLLVEMDSGEAIDPEDSRALLDLVARIARSSIRKSDIVEQLDERTLAIGLPASGRIGMTRVADAIRQRVAAEAVPHGDTTLRTTITIGAVHTTEANLVDIDELVLAARVNLDTARAAGRNRTNWSDWAASA